MTAVSHAYHSRIRRLGGNGFLSSGVQVFIFENGLGAVDQLVEGRTKTQRLT
ncbi:hypothetical protein [Trichococcus collinsii]|uniref:hypothetical protein n=1 Tax=Trichococcus collinsii TaxID=157076 RepID=UPI0015A43A35|nr:hypothetical protein [Trichococcus collinsii]